VSIAPTLAPADAARREWDAIVVGAGPAGSLAAHELARRKLSVLLIDRASFPRWKVCGCCLNGRARAALAAAGLGDLTVRCGAQRLESILLTARGRSVHLPMSASVALSRESFDAALVEAAIRAGADFLPETRAVLEAPPGQSNERVRHVDLHGKGPPLRVAARVVLAATGLGGSLARAEASPWTAPGARIGAGVVIATAPDFYRPGIIYMTCGAAGYLGLVRLEDGRLDLATALDPGCMRTLGGPGAAAEMLLDEAKWPIPEGLAGRGWRGTPALTRGAARVAGDRLFVLGDAAGYVEPFTGEGMAWALGAAIAVAPLAARAARDWQPALAREWGERYRRLVTHRQSICRATAAVLRHPVLAGICVSLLARLPVLAAPVLRRLNRCSPSVGKS
jgi:flavin-dependent dehydrogenase